MIIYGDRRVRDAGGRAEQIEPDALGECHEPGRGALLRGRVVGEQVRQPELDGSDDLFRRAARKALDETTSVFSLGD